MAIATHQDLGREAVDLAGLGGCSEAALRAEPVASTTAHVPFRSIVVGPVPQPVLCTFTA